MKAPLLITLFFTILLFDCQQKEETKDFFPGDSLIVEDTLVVVDTVIIPKDTVFAPPSDLIVLKDAIHFYVFGDFGRRGEFKQRELGRMMDTLSTILPPEFIVSTGDNFYSDGVSSTTDTHWAESFEDIYPTHNGLNCPWYVVLGNHDYHLNPEVQIEYSNISERWTMPDYYYFKDFDKKDLSMRMVFLDTNPFIDDYYGQGKFKNKVILQDTTHYLNWMDSLFSDSTKTWKIAVGHHPIYSGEARASEIRSMKEHVNSRLLKNKVNIYFCAHEHVIRHLKPEGNTHHITSGAGAKTVSAGPVEGTLFASSSTSFVVASATADSIYLQTVNYRGEIEYRTSVKNE